MVGLDRQQAGSGLKEILVVDEAGRALVGGDADVLEDERRQQEVRLVGEGVELLGAADQAGSPGSRGEALAEIDRRPCDARVTKRRPQEPNVRAFVVGDLFSV
jgi:hypothetical protein